MTAATTQLVLYNKALALLGQRKLASTSEGVEPRRVLDDFYSGAQQHCLEQGVWNFAIRNSTETSDATNTIGFTYTFNKPSDWIRTAMISADANFSAPLLDYRDEAGTIQANVSTIYLKYVSNNSSYGLSLTNWTQLFEDYFCAHLARVACPRIITGASDALIDRLEKNERRARAAARAKDAMNDPPGFTPSGAWVAARVGNSRRSRWDRSAF